MQKLGTPVPALITSCTCIAITVVAVVISARLAAGCLPVAPAHLLFPEEEYTAGAG